jgi:hypothetical protein
MLIFRSGTSSTDKKVLHVAVPYYLQFSLQSKRVPDTMWNVLGILGNEIHIPVRHTIAVLQSKKLNAHSKFWLQR